MTSNRNIYTIFHVKILTILQSKIDLIFYLTPKRFLTYRLMDSVRKLIPHLVIRGHESTQKILLTLFYPFKKRD